jgi:predicted metal-dependent hydrolase
MQHQLHINDIHIEYKKSARAKKLAIKINNLACTVELIIPKHISVKVAQKFLDSKYDWVLKHTILFLPKISFKSGISIPILGQEIVIAHSGNIRGISHINNNVLIVSGLVEHLPRKVENFLKDYLYQTILQIMRKIQSVLDVEYNKVSIRNMYSRWGSCSSDGNLSFCLNLVFAPFEILRYIVIHEMCHLLEMNHSRKFWNLVKSIEPNYMQSKIWLKDNAAKLYLYNI